MSEQTKWCNKCKKNLFVSEFFNCKTNVDGLSAYCAEHELSSLEVRAISMGVTANG